MSSYVRVQSLVLHRGTYGFGDIALFINPTVNITGHHISLGDAVYISYLSSPWTHSSLPYSETEHLNSRQHCTHIRPILLTERVGALGALVLSVISN